jgi:hypothetical protein
MPETSRARQRAIARTARRLRPAGYNVRRLAAAALAVFVAGAAIGTTAGLLLGGGSRQAPRVAEPTAPPATAAGDRAGAPVDLTQTLEITDRIVATARQEAEPARAPAWRRNAAAYPEPAPGVPRIAVVIDDLGLNRANARATLALPGPLTLAFMTYAPNPGELTRAARAAGHELLVHVPMQPSDPATDPGPKALSGALDRAELLARLDWGLSRFDGYVGINNHMGSAFTRDAKGMRAVLGELKRRGLMFLDSRTIADSVAGPLADKMGVAHAARDVFLDNKRDVAAIRAQLAEAERIARESGSAVAIGHPYDATIQALSAWLPSLADKNIALVPISALAKGRGPDVARLPADE